MTAAALLPTRKASAKAADGKDKPAFDIGPVTRGFIAIAATAMSLACLVAVARWLTGFAPDHPNIRHAAIVIHVTTVLPCVPLGAWLFLTRKGGKTHKRLGKIWVTLMVVTAATAIFINSSNGFGFIHIFVPITFIGAWKTIATARAGKIREHKKHLIGMYLGALMIPGVLAYVIPGRLMGTWLIG